LLAFLTDRSVRELTAALAPRGRPGGSRAQVIMRRSRLSYMGIVYDDNLPAPCHKPFSPARGGGSHAQRQGSASVRGFVAAGLSRGGACAAGDGHRKVTDIMITR
jgi:hypothetical protein